MKTFDFYYFVDTSLIGVSLKQATLQIASSPRPLTLRFQVGLQKQHAKMEVISSEPQQEV